MISNIDWIALTALIVFVWIQIPYHNGNNYSAMPVWLNYIGAKFCNGKMTISSEANLAGKLVFSVVWFILYALLTATGYLMYTQVTSAQTMQAFYALFLINIILTKFWPPVFFGEYHFFSWKSSGHGSDGVSEEKFRVMEEGSKNTKQKVEELIVHKYNLPTVVRVFLAGFIGLLIFGTSAALLGITIYFAAAPVLTNTATLVVSILTYSLYTIWTLAALVMTIYINVNLCIYNEPLSKLHDVTKSTTPK